MNRVSKSTIDWGKIYQKLAPSMGGVFRDIKTRQDNIVTKISLLPSEKPKIDWDYYRKIIALPELVDKMKTDYESFKVPEPKDINNWHELLKVDEDKLTREIKESKTIDDKIIAASERLLRVGNTCLPKENEVSFEILHVYYPEHSAHESAFFLPPRTSTVERIKPLEVVLKDKPFFRYD